MVGYTVCYFAKVLYYWNRSHCFYKPAGTIAEDMQGCTCTSYITKESAQYNNGHSRDNAMMRLMFVSEYETSKCSWAIVACTYHLTHHRVHLSCRIHGRGLFSFENVIHRYCYLKYTIGKLYRYFMILFLLTKAGKLLLHAKATCCVFDKHIAFTAPW
jgi:hypothetical protein